MILLIILLGIPTYLLMACITAAIASKLNDDIGWLDDKNDDGGDLFGLASSLLWPIAAAIGLVFSLAYVPFTSMKWVTRRVYELL